MTLIDCGKNPPVHPESEKNVSHVDVVRALTVRLARPEPVLVEDFDAELRRWLLSSN